MSRNAETLKVIWSFRETGPNNRIVNYRAELTFKDNILTVVDIGVW